MNAFVWPSIGFYCIFGIFVFYQQLHVRSLGDASPAFALALNLSAMLGLITGLVFLAFYGWHVSWWAPFVIFVIGVLANLGGFLAERVVGAKALCLTGFAGWPVAAYLMYSYVPRSA